MPSFRVLSPSMFGSLNRGALSLAVVSLLASTAAAEVFDKLAAVPEGKSTGNAGAFASSVKAGAVGIAALEANSDRVAIQLLADPNSNLVESRTVIPTLRGDIAAGQTKWYVTAVFARPSGEGIEPKAYLDGWEKKPSIPAWLKMAMLSPF